MANSAHRLMGAYLRNGTRPLFTYFNSSKVFRQQFLLAKYP
jgi:hypothetical protein